MLYHDNGKLQIFANTRCGNISMHHYFNICINKQKNFPKSFSQDLVIVLRNPLDRMESAVKGISTLENRILDIAKFDHLKWPGIFPSVNLTEKELTKEVTKEWLIFHIHCTPYLHRVFEKPFRIIDFNQLSDYIPKDTKLYESPTTYSSGNTDPKSVYVENQYFTLEDLEREYELYLELLLAREQISVAEWKEKTL
jgi:hypothetical protein